MTRCFEWPNEFFPCRGECAPCESCGQPVCEMHRGYWLQDGRRVALCEDDWINAWWEDHWVKAMDTLRANGMQMTLF